jgi:hypothetical protein
MCLRGIIYLNIEFRVFKIKIDGKTWLKLVLMKANITFEIWTIITLGSFTVKSMYADMMNGHMFSLFEKIHQRNKNTFKY